VNDNFYVPAFSVKRKIFLGYPLKGLCAKMACIFDSNSSPYTQQGYCFTACQSGTKPSP